jgi:hypothetical protein
LAVKDYKPPTALMKCRIWERDLRPIFPCQKRIATNFVACSALVHFVEGS